MYYSVKMTEIPLRLKEGQPTPQTQKWLRHPYHKKNDRNTPEARKITEMPLKPIKGPQYPWIIRKKPKLEEI